MSYSNQPPLAYSQQHLHPHSYQQQHHQRQHQQQQQQQQQQQRPYIQSSYDRHAYLFDPQSRTYRLAGQTKWIPPPTPSPPPSPLPSLLFSPFLWLFAPLFGFFHWLSSLPPLSSWPSILIDMFLLAPVSSLLAATRDFLLSPKTHKVVFRLSVLVTIFWVSSAAAVISYVGFYRAWVPEVGLRKPVWLQYGHNEPPFYELRFDASSAERGLSDAPPSFFAIDQAYDVTLEMGVPLNDANLDLGNFMVTLDLKSATDRSVYHVSQPTLLNYSPAPVRALSMFSQLISRNPPPSRLPSDSQLLTISLLKRVVLRPSSSALPLSPKSQGPKTDRRITHGRVSVGRQDADRFWMYGGSPTGYMPSAHHRANAAVAIRSSRGELQTYSASLRFDAHLTGLRYFMYHHPLISFLLFTSLFLGFELATALALWAMAAIYSSSATPEQLSLTADEHFQQEKRRARQKSRAKPESATAESTPESEPLFDNDSDNQTETETKREPFVIPRIEVEEDIEADLIRLRSLEALRTREAAIRAARYQSLMEARRLAGFEMDSNHPPISTEDLAKKPLPRRVLNRLEEETEEDTEVSETVSEPPSSPRVAPEDAGDEERWEDLEEIEPTSSRAATTEAGEKSASSSQKQKAS